MTDALTGLPNLRSLQDNLKRMLAHAGRNASHLSVLAIDLDHFKQINDVYGHEKGDEALAAVGDLLSSSVRASDIAARNGGEEFIVVLADADKESAAGVAENLRARLEQISITGLDRRVTGSFGVATYPEDATEPAMLMRAADRALYLAKESGRNTVRLISPSAEPATPTAGAV
jgi:two-component system cell cycle response regulator